MTPTRLATTAVTATLAGIVLGALILDSLFVGARRDGR